MSTAKHILELQSVHAAITSLAIPSGNIMDLTWLGLEDFSGADIWTSWALDPEIEFADFEPLQCRCEVAVFGSAHASFAPSPEPASTNISPCHGSKASLCLRSDMFLFGRTSCSGYSPKWKSNGLIYTSRRNCISKAAQEIITSGYIEGTCDWFLNSLEFTRWRNDSSGVLWLSGVPGAGKSHLTFSVLRKLKKDRRPGELVASYFVDADFKGVNHTASILWAMLVEIISQDPQHLDDRDISSLVTNLTQLGGHLSLLRMKKCLFNILHGLRIHETLYLLLDGLNENSQSPDETELLHEFLDYAVGYHSSHRIKCFISTTPAFYHPLGARKSTHVDLDVNPLKTQDTSLYIRRNLQNRKLPDNILKDGQFCLRLLEAAKGSFLWARLIMDEMEESKAFTSMAVGLNLVGAMALSLGYSPYGSMFSRIDDHNKDAVFSMLRWVVYAARPLESLELVDALHIEKDIKITGDDILHISAGLLQSVGGKIRLAHHTVRDYLQTNTKGSWEDLSFEANEMIAAICLKLLSTFDLFLSLGLRISKREVSANQGISYHPLISYARKNWVYHYLYAEEHSSYLAGLLHDLLDKGLRKNRQHSCNDPNMGEAPCNEDYITSLDVVNLVARISSRYGFRMLLKLELDMGAIVDMPSGLENRSPLILAAWNGHLEIVRLLLRYGAGTYHQCEFGNTALMYALSRGQYAVVELLIAHELQTVIDFSTNSELLLPGTLKQFATQDYMLKVSYPSSQLSLAPVASEEENILPPILLRGEYMSEAGATDRGQCNIEHTPMFKWFSGVKMYTILSYAAQCGIEDVKRLLVIAGNNGQHLERIIH